MAKEPANMTSLLQISKDALLERPSCTPSSPESNLLIAVFEGDEHNIKEILHQGVTLDARDHSNRTTLHWACLAGRLSIVQFLLDEGADVNVVDAKGITALVYSIWSEKGDISELLLRNGADSNAICIQGTTALHWASMAGV